MREVLFRAKKTGTLEWVEGFVSSPYEKTMCTFVELSTRVTWYVDENTIGQYTGVTDIRGKKIFEGDIVNVDGAFKVVRFGKHEIECCGCCYKSHSSVGFYLESDNEEINAYERMWDELYVIGNIHDNPELLKGESKS